MPETASSRCVTPPAAVRHRKGNTRQLNSLSLDWRLRCRSKDLQYSSHRNNTLKPTCAEFFWRSLDLAALRRLAMIRRARFGSTLGSCSTGAAQRGTHTASEVRAKGAGVFRVCTRNSALLGPTH